MSIVMIQLNYLSSVISEAVSYCASNNSSIQTNFSIIDQKVEKELLEKAKEKEVWTYQANYGPNLYVSLWTGGVRNGISSFRFGI